MGSDGYQGAKGIVRAQGEVNAMRSMETRKRWMGVVVLALLLTAAAAGPALATSFVSEATVVVDRINKESQSANQEIEEFYRSFSKAAGDMIALEAKVDQWKKEGYLCDQYAKCPEKYDLIYAYYADRMAQIQRAFDQHRDAIQAALARFNRVVYEGRDRIADLRAGDSVKIKADLHRLSLENERLRNLRSNLEQQCPISKQMSRSCARRWRAFRRDAARVRRNLQRLLYVRRLNKLRRSIIDRLENILDSYSTLEADAVESLADYAFIFEQYGELSGASGIGQLFQAVKQIRELDRKLSQMEKFGKGLQLHVLQVGKLMDDRLAQIEEQDIRVYSRSQDIEDATNLLEGNDKLIRQLEKEVGAQ